MPPVRALNPGLKNLHRQLNAVHIVDAFVVG
jgi:hypothetical protein